jgi:hypothetical protein
LTLASATRIRTPKLAALHFYQLALPAPMAPTGSYDKVAFERGKTVFNGAGQCATCHVPPLYTEPGHNMHTPSEIGIDSFQADRSPTHMYRTAPLAGLWAHQKGGFFHDGRFRHPARRRQSLRHPVQVEPQQPEQEGPRRVSERDLSRSRAPNQVAYMRYNARGAAIRV